MPREPRAPARASLGVCRIVVGSIFLLRTTPLGAPLLRWPPETTTPLLGWADGRWHGAAVLFALPGAIVNGLCVLRTAAALAFLFGVFSRAAGLAAGALGYLLLLQQPFHFQATLHLLYLAVILLAVTDAGSSLALRPSPPKSPATSALLIQLFVASIYLWSAVAKLRPDWLDGRALALFFEDRLIHGALADFLLATSARRAAIAWGVFIVEALLGPLLLWRRTRAIGLGLAYSLHVALELTARPDALGWTMMALLLCFFGPAQRGSQLADAAGETTSPSPHISSSVRRPGST